MEKELIKRQLFKNLFLTFVTFSLLLSLFDIFIYGAVERSVMASVDEELRLGKMGYEWRRLDFDSNIEDDADTISFFSEENAHVARPLSLNSKVNVANSQADETEKRESGEVAEHLPNAKEEKPPKPFENAPSGDNATKHERRQKIIENADIDEKDKKNLDRLLSRLDIVNPRLITVERTRIGEIENPNEIGNIYTAYFEDLSFDAASLNSVYDISLGDFHYRGLNFFKNSENESDGYVQLLINIDSERNSVTNVSKVLALGSAIILIFSLAASYLLSKKTIRPIVEGYRKEAEFVQNASHELRTPLTVIRTKQELLLQEPERKIIEKSEDIGIALRETRRLTKLIDDLMTLAKSDAEVYVINRQVVDVDAMVKEVIAPYIDLFADGQKEISLDLNFHKNYSLDCDKISEVLIILLDNAIKYTKPNDKITIKTYEENRKLVIAVEDTGIGIDSNSRAKIFDRFYREDKSHSRKIGGNGLGLSIARMIVSAHHGFIKVHSNKPKGTIFTIKI